MKRSRKTKLPAEAKGSPKNKSREMRPPSTIPSPPGVIGRSPIKRYSTETAVRIYRERGRLRAKAINLRRTISRIQTAEDRRRVETKDLLSFFEFCCISFRRGTNFSLKYHDTIPVIIKAKSKRNNEFDINGFVRGENLISNEGNIYRT